MQQALWMDPGCRDREADPGFPFSCEHSMNCQPHLAISPTPLALDEGRRRVKVYGNNKILRKKLLLTFILHYGKFTIG